ncbi:MAG: nitroreductase family protein [Bacteroidales bacterium]|jgi:predicted oxidoreductase (fatty acid repression mutant protein)|nr:nitroreductase family protein [Bacteroidales bacterium]
MEVNKSLLAAIQHRRTYYAITDKSPVSDKELERILKFTILNIPSAFNSQSTRIVLLLDDNHKRLWELTKQSLKKIIPESNFLATETKINSFEAGYGTILFYEDQQTVKGLQEQFSAYKDNFPVWSHQTSAMHQFAIWVLLEDIGFGVSLQHYNPLIDEDVQKEWNINPDWKLIAEMPFGLPSASPGEKEFLPVDERIKVFKGK